MDLLTVPVSVLTFLIGAIATAAWIERRTWLRRQGAKRVVVHMNGTLSIEGTLLRLEADGVVLVQAHRSSQDTLDGEIYIPREQITFIQTAEQRLFAEGFLTRALRGLRRSRGAPAS